MRHYVSNERLPKQIYFLRRKDGVGPVKIGCSRRPIQRLTDLYRWSPYELTLLASAPGGSAWERGLHARFAAYRLHMEWFAPAPALLAGIDAIINGASLEEAFADATPIQSVREKREARAA